MKTKILKLSNKDSVDATLAVLRLGGVAVIPTETSYGLAADACNKKAVARIYALKKRTRTKSLPVIVASVAMANRFFLLNKAAQGLCRFPAPLTLIVRQRGKKLARNISRDDTIAFRVPKNKFCREVSRRAGRPITSTSANISGKQPVFFFSQVKKLFSGRVELIVDAGNLKKSRSSTILNCVASPVQIVRKGAFPLRRLFSH